MIHDWGKILYFAIAAAAGIASGWCGQPLIHHNEQAVTVIVTVFSILAGFLVAITTILSDPGPVVRRSWRTMELHRDNIVRRISRQKWLFVLYLITLGLILASTSIDRIWPCAVVWLERIYLGMAVAAFLISLSLPWSLTRIQLDRYDEQIADKRKHAGIRD
jgi:hypothetical protein